MVVSNVDILKTASKSSCISKCLNSLYGKRSHGVKFYKRVSKLMIENGVKFTDGSVYVHPEYEDLAESCKDLGDVFVMIRDDKTEHFINELRENYLRKGEYIKVVKAFIGEYRFEVGNQYLKLIIVDIDMKQLKFNKILDKQIVCASAYVSKIKEAFDNLGSMVG